MPKADQQQQRGGAGGPTSRRGVHNFCDHDVDIAREPGRQRQRRRGKHDATHTVHRLIVFAAEYNSMIGGRGH
jgi:hypothetical protein